MATQIAVNAVDDGRRLDRFLEKLEGGLPASLVRRLLRQRRIRVNDRRVRDGSLRLSAGDRIEIHAELRTEAPTADGRTWGLEPLNVLYRDEAFLVVDKPPKIACSDDGKDPFAIQVWLREFLDDEIRAGRARPEPCHRLDRGTTGVVVVALTPAAFERFRRALEDGRVNKTYQLVVRGEPDQPQFSCRQALRRVQTAGPNEPRMVAGDELEARTDFRVLGSSDGLSLLEARLHTGRTHQIRAHCRILGLPIIGDPRYGEPAPPGHQLLHAAELELVDEGGWRVVSEWPAAEAEWLHSQGLAT